MNTAFVSKDKEPPERLLSEWKNEWKEAVEYLISNNYEQVITTLRKRQTAASENGEARLVSLLEAAIQICEACAQHQSQVELHSQAMTQSLQRQQQLQQQMLAFLTSTIHSAASSREERGPQEMRQGQRVFATNGYNSPDTPHGLWQGQESRPAPRKADGITLSVYFLGAFRVFVNGRPINNWSGNRCKSIFKHMIMNRHRPVHHEILMDLFWPEESPDAARRNLYQAIYLLRQALQQDDSSFQFITCHDGAYSFNAELEIWVDSALFEEQYTRGLKLEKDEQQKAAVHAYEAADDLYSGDFLAEDIYEEWTLVHRERIKHAHLDLLDRISLHYWLNQQYPQCITYCKKILQDDNCREDIHRRLMLAYLNQGQRHLAIRQYHHCVEVLAHELDVEPLSATSQLFNQIMNGEPPIP